MYEARMANERQNIETAPVVGADPYQQYLEAQPHIFSDVGPIQSIQTEASINPTENKLTLVGDQNAVRIFTNTTNVDEPYFYLYVKRSPDNNVLKIKLYRWQGRILIAPKGSNISFGTLDGRTITTSVLTVNLNNLDTIEGSTGTVNCDEGGIPLWEPSAPHIIFPSNGSSFTIQGGNERQVYFVSENDDVVWSPPRFVIVPPNQSINVKCNYKKIALANYDGTVAFITASSIATIGGVSNTTHLTFPTVTNNSRIVSDIDQFNDAITGSINGDEIVLAPGVYVMNKNVDESTFSSNVLAGNIGMSGITIRGQSGNRNDTIISASSSSSGSWSINHNETTLHSGFKDLTFDFNNKTLSFQIFGGYWSLENVRWTNTSGLNHEGMVFFRSSESSSIYANLLNCQSDLSSGDCYDGQGSLSTPAIASSSIVNLVNCVGFDAGNGVSDQIISTHTYLPLYVYGGHYSGANSGSKLIACGNYTETVYCYFTKLSDAVSNRFTPTTSSAKVNNVNLFGCFWSSSFLDTITTNPSGTIFFNNIHHLGNTNLFSYGNSAINTGSIIANNFINSNKSSVSRVVILTGNGIQFYNNVVSSSSDTIRTNTTANPTDLDNKFWNNTFYSGSTTMLFNILTQSYSFSIVNNACAVAGNGSIFGINTSSFNVMTGHEYNVFSNKNTASYIPQINDITQSIPALNYLTFIPISGSNCDQNGSSSLYDYIGDADYLGRVFIHKPNIISRGAVSRQFSDENIIIYPDIW